MIKIDFIIRGKKCIHHFGVIFVAQNSEDKPPRLGREIGVKAFSERKGAIRVVGTVYD